MPWPREEVKLGKVVRAPDAYRHSNRQGGRLWDCTDVGRGQEGPASPQLLHWGLPASEGTARESLRKPPVPFIKQPYLYSIFFSLSNGNFHSP